MKGGSYHNVSSIDRHAVVSAVEEDSPHCVGRRKERIVRRRGWTRVLMAEGELCVWGGGGGVRCVRCGRGACTVYLGVTVL